MLDNDKEQPTPAVTPGAEPTQQPSDPLQGDPAAVDPATAAGLKTDQDHTTDSPDH